MLDETTEIALKGIVEGYFRGENLSELIVGAADYKIISSIKNNFDKFRR